MTAPHLHPLSPFSCLVGSHCPLDPISGPAQPSCPLGLSSQAYPALTVPQAPPQELSVSLYPRWPHLRPCPALTVPSAPAGPTNSPSIALHPLGPRPAAASPPPGHQAPWSSSPTLPSSSLPHGPPDTHYSLSSTMSLRSSAAARCPPGLPPASRRPLSPWPGPARLPVRLRRGLLSPRRSRCGRRAGSCRPGLADSRAAADAARSSGSAAPRGGGASLRQPERHTQRCALTSARRRSLLGPAPSRP